MKIGEDRKKKKVRNDVKIMVEGVFVYVSMSPCHLACIGRIVIFRTRN